MQQFAQAIRNAVHHSRGAGRSVHPFRKLHQYRSSVLFLARKAIEPDSFQHTGELPGKNGDLDRRVVVESGVGISVDKSKNAGHFSGNQQGGSDGGACTIVSKERVARGVRLTDKDRTALVDCGPRNRRRFRTDASVAKTRRLVAVSFGSDQFFVRRATPGECPVGAKESTGDLEE